MTVNLASAALSGFIATTILTVVMTAGQGLRLSRMSMPFILGTMFTPNRNRALVLGFLSQWINGWAFALVYALIFEDLRAAGGWLGALLGLCHGLAVLVIVLPILPAAHPRMADEHRGPEPTRALEPPGFLALNYGRATPIITLMAHLLYGAILGVGYKLTG
jgi:hypothetical protein